jgi:hypothetical protein
VIFIFFLHLDIALLDDQLNNLYNANANNYKLIPSSSQTLEDLKRNRRIYDGDETGRKYVD